MASRTQEDERLALYLLGGLSERERERLEAEYFEDDDAFERMLIAEEELTDAYVRGGLSAEERARFEKSYLASARGCERVHFARALAGAVSDARPAETAPVAPVASGSSLFAAVRSLGAGWRVAFAAAVVVAAVGLTWLLVERARMRDEMRQLRGEVAALNERAQESERRAAAEQARSGELLAQLEGERARPTQEGDGGQPERPSQEKGVKQGPGASVLSFVLTPGLVRGGGARTLNVPAGASSVALRLSVEEGAYQSYRAVIQTPDEREVWRADSLKPRAGGTLNLPPIPARVLPPGDYALLLSGQRPDGGFERAPDYTFRVVRK